MERKTCCLVSAIALVAMLIIVGIGVWLWVRGGPEPPPIEVTTYPEPVDNTYPRLFSAACALKPGEDEISAAYRRPWNTPDPAADALVTRFEGELDAIHEALAGDCVRPWVVDATRTRLDDLLGFRDATWLLCLAGRACERVGDTAAALTSYEDVVRLSQVLEKNGAAMHALVAGALLPISAPDLQRLVASGGLTEAELQELLAFLDTAWEERVPFAETLAKEWLYSDTMMEEALRVAAGNASVSRVGIFMVRRWRREAPFHFADAIADAKKPYWERTYVPPQGYGMAATYMVAVTEAAPEVPQRDAILQGLRTQAAIELFRAREGRLPATLKELVPDVLPEVPIDPCDGKPMRYRLAGENYLLYSVGPDKTDDHGKFTIGRKVSRADAPLGDVIIWSPSRAAGSDEQSGEEVQAAP